MTAPNPELVGGDAVEPSSQACDAELRALRARWQEASGAQTPREAVLSALASGAAPPSDLRGIHLVGENLEAADLSGCDLSHADLSQCVLRGAKLMRARLDHALLVEADLSGAELLAADLHGANLSECTAGQTGFGNANLSDSLLFGADLRGATFSNACLRDADLRGADLSEARMRDCELSGADLTRACLRNTDLNGSVVQGASFVETDLRHAELQGLKGFASASFLGAEIRDVNFSRAYLVRRHIMDENFLDEFRRQSRLSNITYWVWWITSDCGRSISRFGACVTLVTLGFGMAYQAVDVDFGGQPTALSPYYFSLVTITTLGYGEIVPVSMAAQALVMCQLSLGYLLLGGLLSIFATKMARRAE